VIGNRRSSQKATAQIGQSIAENSGSEEHCA
jgi:hypothetical protein